VIRGSDDPSAGPTGSPSAMSMVRPGLSDARSVMSCQIVATAES